MVSRGKTPLSAVLDIGSGQVALEIIQISGEGGIQVLEKVTKALPVGRDTFSTGRISPEMVEELCDAVNGFKQLLRDYKVRVYRAVATSAFREAKNREYVLDQIKVKTGIAIEVLSNSEERYYTQLAVLRSLGDYADLRKNGILVMNIGSGNLQLSGYGKEGLEYNQSFHLGSLRIHQMFSSIEEESLQFPRVIEEYVMTHIERHILPFSHIVATGSKVELLRRVFPKSPAIRRDDFDALYNHFLHMPAHTLASRYHLDEESAAMIVPAMIIIRTLWNYSKADTLRCPDCAMQDGILAEMNRAYLLLPDDVLEGEILTHARSLARTYGYDEAHAEDVREKALLLFDRFAKSQGFTHRHRLILQIATIFHDTGKFINVTQHDQYSAMLVSSSDLIGLSTEEQNMISRIARYHEDDELDRDDPVYLSLTRKNRLTTAKLIAILQLANAMDASHKQKLTNVSVKIDEKTLQIRMLPRENYLLEKWMFERHEAFFQDVFGLKPELKVKRGSAI